MEMLAFISSLWPWTSAVCAGKQNGFTLISFAQGRCGPQPATGSPGGAYFSRTFRRNSLNMEYIVVWLVVVVDAKMLETGWKIRDH